MIEAVERERRQGISQLTYLRLAAVRDPKAVQRMGVMIAAPSWSEKIF